MKTLNQDDFFTLQTLVLEEMKREHHIEGGKQSRYFRKLAKMLAKLNGIAGNERKFR